MMKYLKLMRIKHYIKNILIFLPIAFSGQLINIELLSSTLCGFIAFCFMTSVVYIVNDIRDCESDRKHPTKCTRPIANGSVSKKSAWILAGILFISAVLINIAIIEINSFSIILLILYFALNLMYSFGMKNVPIVDIAILVSGFLIRVLYGSAITGIEISRWLHLTVIAMSFFLGLGKRRNELLRCSNEKTRKVLQFYNNNFLDKNMYMCITLAIAFYSLWSVDFMTIERIGSTNLVWTVPFVIIICMKYSLNIEGNSDGDPVEVVFKDKILLGLILLFAIITLSIIYI